MGWGDAASIIIGAYLQSRQKPEMPNVPPPPPPPQVAKMPTTGAFLAGMQGTGQAGGKAGLPQTFLTGTAGIDPNALKLGKPTLLGQ